MTATMNPNRGWRINPADPDAAVARTEAGRFALPVVIECDGVLVAAVDLVFTGDQIEMMHASMRSLVSAGFPVQTTQHRRKELNL